MPATAAFLKPTRPFSFVSLDPFIASLSTDLVVTAQLAEGVFVRQISSDELNINEEDLENAGLALAWVGKYLPMLWD